MEHTAGAVWSALCNVTATGRKNPGSYHSYTSSCMCRCCALSAASRVLDALRRYDSPTHRQYGGAKGPGQTAGQLLFGDMVVMDVGGEGQQGEDRGRNADACCGRVLLRYPVEGGPGGGDVNGGGGGGWTVVDPAAPPPDLAAAVADAMSLLVPPPPEHQPVHAPPQAQQRGRGAGAGVSGVAAGAVEGWRWEGVAEGVAAAGGEGGGGEWCPLPSSAIRRPLPMPRLIAGDPPWMVSTGRCALWCALHMPQSTFFGAQRTAVRSGRGFCRVYWWMVSAFPCRQPVHR